jgi:hypothetical protein
MFSWAGEWAGLLLFQGRPIRCPLAVPKFTSVEFFEMREKYLFRHIYFLCVFVFDIF